MISIFDIFKIGIGPSSSHTVGPMKAGFMFSNELKEKGLIPSINRVVADVYGSLSLTGRGHMTDIAIAMGLEGNLPETVDIGKIDEKIKTIKKHKELLLFGKKTVSFDWPTSMVFHNTNLPLHENGLEITAFNDDKVVFKKTYYSTGGGFVVDAEHFGKEAADEAKVPYPFKLAEELQNYCENMGLSVSALTMKNELAINSQEVVDEKLSKIWKVMQECIIQGCETEGVLPGPLQILRRAPILYRKLSSIESAITGDPMLAIDWVSMFAMAVGEENASGCRVITSPTNGACGVIPAVLSYYDKFVKKVDKETYTRYFMTSGTIGILYKLNASIAGAEVGCQGEVGVACSMAAAGLAEILGGSVEQVFSAAEIGMEHNLGLTCDPVNGQVQIPCIERNAVASVKAITSARMALERSSKGYISLDQVIKTMYETGKDMNSKYRETSQGGLAKLNFCCHTCH